MGNATTDKRDGRSPSPGRDLMTRRCMYLRIAVPLLFLFLVSETLITPGLPIRPISKLVNDSVTFTMGPAECAPEDTTIRWKSHEKYQEIGFCRKRLFNGISPQFHNRVDCNGDTRVTIRNLSRADSGLYILSYTLQCKVKKDVKYHDLTVYEPVPATHIEKNVVRNSACWCNFTLRCCVPGKASVERYLWLKGRNETGYHLYRHGPSIQVSLQSQSFGSLDEEYICTVYNPGDQKNTSINIKDICTLMADSSIHCNLKRPKSAKLQGTICIIFSYVVLALTLILVLKCL
ncbi:hypothetical protein XENTR_v10022413 [Xenopus tropicalis]|uniref:SLAM family member 9-like n=1 Tax=Xenopus tropicalis TaxID=8364 RepID=A0A8J1IUV2_XENTR|nr:SLAM family member 9-like [Xenopus tropicalis]KAE8588217.1 hypothetical protein XENTR_v10022413 [Xenopus tropicalis]